MKFNLNHDPNNKTLAIPRAALQLSGLAGVSDLILHTDSGCILLLYRVAGKLGRFRRFHVRLWQVLTGRDSYVVLSYNDCPFIRKLYQDWYISSFQRSNPLSQKKGSSFGELIITNYDPRPYMTSQMNLFDEPLGEWELKLVHIPKHPPRRKTA